MKRTIQNARAGRTHDALNRDGFTLLEVVVALGILATAMVLLLESHYGSLRLFDSAQESAIADGLMEHAIAVSETEVLVGELSGQGDFGRRLPHYSFSYLATPVDEDSLQGLLEVIVTVSGPAGDREMTFLTYDGIQLET